MIAMLVTSRHRRRRPSHSSEGIPGSRLNKVHLIAPLVGFFPLLMADSFHERPSDVFFRGNDAESYKFKRGVAMLNYMVRRVRAHARMHARTRIQ